MRDVDLESWSTSPWPRTFAMGLPAELPLDDWAFVDDEGPPQPGPDGVIHGLTMGEFAVNELPSRYKARRQRGAKALERQRAREERRKLDDYDKQKAVARKARERKERKAFLAECKLPCPTCARPLKPEQLCQRCFGWAVPQAYVPKPEGAVTLTLHSRSFVVTPDDYVIYSREAQANGTDLAIWAAFRRGLLG